MSPPTTGRFGPVRLRAGALFVLIAFGACVSEPVPIRSQHLEYSGCDGAERAAIAGAFDRAADLTQRTLATLRDPLRHERARSGAWSAYQTWFGAYSAARYDRIEAVYRSAELEFEQPYSMRCGDRSLNCPDDDAVDPLASDDYDARGPDYDADFDPGRSWKTFAFTNTGVRAIQICRDFFNESPRERAAIVLHELTHIVRDTEDYAYRESAVIALAEDDPERAAHNAPSFAAFATDVVFGRKPGEGVSVPEPVD